MNYWMGGIVVRGSNFYDIIRNNKWAFENKNICVLCEGLEPELWFLIVRLKKLKINQIQLIEPMYGSTIYALTTIQTIPSTFNEFVDIITYGGNETEDLPPDELETIISKSDLFIKFRTTQDPIIYLNDNIGHIKAIYDNDEIVEWDYYFSKPEAIELTFGRIRFKKGNTDLVLKFNNSDIMLDFDIPINELKAEAGIEPYWGQEFLKEIKKLLNHYAE